MQLGWPLPSDCQRISQRFAERPSFNPDYYSQWSYPGHPAIDIACDIGTETYATHNGWTEPRSSEVLGEHVYVYTHDGRVKTRHSHLSIVEVSFGQHVHEGERLGLSGDTGWVTGPHLDYGLQVTGVGRPEFKGWVDPYPYLRRREMSSKISISVQRCDLLRPGQAGEWVVHHIVEAGVWAVVLIDPDVLGAYNPFPEVHTMGRLVFPGDPDLALIQHGAAGARQYVAMCAPRQDACPWIRLWHAPNEPFTGNPLDPNDLDPMRWLTEFTVELVRLNRQRGLDTGVGVFGTAQPAGPPANPMPTITRKWEIFGPACLEAAVLVLHEYGMDTLNPTPENEWHIEHYKRGVAALQAAGFRVPPIWITEHGIDRGGGAETDGWQVKLGGNEVEYMRQLAVRGIAYSADPIIQIVTPFVWLDWNWPSFTIIQGMSRRIVDHIVAKGAYRPGGMPAPPPVEVLASLLTSNEVMRLKGRWWTVPLSIKDAYAHGDRWYAELAADDPNHVLYLAYDQVQCYNKMVKTSRQTGRRTDEQPL